MIISHTLTGELHSKFDNDKEQADFHVIDAGGAMFSFFLNHAQLIAFIQTLRQIETGFSQSRTDRDVARWIEWASKHMEHPMLTSFACDVLHISPTTAARAARQQAEDSWEADDELPRTPDVAGGIVDIDEQHPAAITPEDEVQALALSKNLTLHDLFNEPELARKAIGRALAAGKVTFY